MEFLELGRAFEALGFLGSLFLPFLALGFLELRLAVGFLPPKAGVVARLLEFSARLLWPLHVFWSNSRPKICHAVPAPGHTPHRQAKEPPES